MFRSLILVLILALTGCMTPRADVDRLERAVVIISGEIDGRTWSATGFIVSRSRVMTAGHVAVGETTLTITLIDQREIEGKVVWVGEDTDVGFIAADIPPDLPVARLTCRRPRLGEDIRVIGHPYPARFVLQGGHVALGRSPAEGEKDLVMVDLPGNFGSSGSPIYTADGKVVMMLVGDFNRGYAITRQGLTPIPTGLSFGVPGDVLCRALEHAQIAGPTPPKSATKADL